MPEKQYRLAEKIKFCVLCALRQALLDLGAPVNCVNEDGLTPLYLCASSQTDTDAEVIEMLLRDYAQQGVRNTSGCTELHHVSFTSSAIIHCTRSSRIHNCRF